MTGIDDRTGAIGRGTVVEIHTSRSGGDPRDVIARVQRAFDDLDGAPIAGVLLPEAGDRPGGPLDPTILAAALRTEHTVLVGASTSRHAPYNLARRIASLARLDDARFGLVLTADGVDEATLRLGGTRAKPVQLGALWDEYAEVLRGLIGSFPPAALVGDVAAGRFADVSLLAALHHDGPVYSVEGPLDIPADEAPLIAVSGVAAWSARTSDAVLVGRDEASPPLARTVWTRVPLRDYLDR